MECPVCHQLDQVQKVSAIVSSGTSNTSSTGEGLTIGSEMGGHAMGGAVGVTNFKTKSRQQSVLADVLSPPEKQKYDSTPWKVSGAMATIFLLFLPGAYSLLSVFFVIAILYLYDKKSSAFNNNNLPHYKLLLDRWNHTFYCHRCDVAFYPGVAFIPAGNLSSMLEYNHYEREKKPAETETAKPDKSYSHKNALDEFKQMLDIGIITEDQYRAKEKELLQ